MGTTGDHQGAAENINLPPAGAGSVQARRPYPRFGNISLQTQAQSSDYHALQLKVQQRPSRGLWYLVSYTYSNSTRRVPAPEIGGNYTYERQPQPWDIRHLLAASYATIFHLARPPIFVGAKPRSTRSSRLHFKHHHYRTAAGHPDIARRRQHRLGVTPNRVASGALAEPTIDGGSTKRVVVPTISVLNSGPASCARIQGTPLLAFSVRDGRGGRQFAPKCHQFNSVLTRRTQLLHRAGDGCRAPRIRRGRAIRLSTLLDDRNGALLDPPRRPRRSLSRRPGDGAAAGAAPAYLDPARPLATLDDLNRSVHAGGEALPARHDGAGLARLKARHERLEPIFTACLDPAAHVPGADLDGCDVEPGAGAEWRRRSRRGACHHTTGRFAVTSNDLARADCDCGRRWAGGCATGAGLRSPDQYHPRPLRPHGRRSRGHLLTLR